MYVVKYNITGSGDSFLILSLSLCLSWWTIIPWGYHPPRNQWNVDVLCRYKVLENDELQKEPLKFTNVSQTTKIGIDEFEVFHNEYNNIS
jgi:hypothetical protein